MTVVLIAACTFTGPVVALCAWCLLTDPTYRALRARRTARRQTVLVPFDWRTAPGCEFVRQGVHVHRKTAS